MAFKLYSDVRETTTTGGTGDQVLTGSAFDTSYVRFNDRYSDADTFFYRMKQPGVGWEIGLGTRVASGDKITRTQVYKSSNSNALVNFTNGVTIDIFVTNIAPQDLDAAGLVLLRQSMGLGIYDASLSLTSAQQVQNRANIYAAPFDALAYNGMQVNGSLDVSQELGTTGATLSSASSKYVADCIWSYYTASVGVLTSAQIASSAPSGTAVVGFPNAVNLKATTKMSVQGSLADGNFACITHPIEGYRIARLGLGSAGANSFSIGVWWYSTNAGTTFFRVSNVTSGAGRYFYQEVTLAAGWNYVTATIPGDTSGTWQQTTSNGMVIQFYGAGKNTSPVATTAGVATWSATEKVATTNSTSLLSTNNNDQIAITGLIVLPGIELPSSTRAPFIMRPFDQELNISKRYWQKSYDYGTAVGAVATAGSISFRQQLSEAFASAGTFFFNPAMRVDPTVTIYSPNTGTSGKIYNGNAVADFNAAVSYGAGTTSVSIQINNVSQTQFPSTNSAHIVADARL